MTSQARVFPDRIFHRASDAFSASLHACLRGVRAPVRVLCVGMLGFAITSMAGAEELPAPSNLESAKSDLLQLDRTIASLKQRLTLPARTLLLFGLTPQSQLSVRSIAVRLDGRSLPVREYDAQALNALLQGGMDTLMDANLPVGDHILEVLVTLSDKAPVSQRIEFTKTLAKDIVAIKFKEHPGLDEQPLAVVEWSQHD